MTAITRQPGRAGRMPKRQGKRAAAVWLVKSLGVEIFIARVSLCCNEGLMHSWLHGMHLTQMQRMHLSGIGMSRIYGFCVSSLHGKILNTSWTCLAADLGVLPHRLRQF